MTSGGDDDASSGRRVPRSVAADSFLTALRGHLDRWRSRRLSCSAYAAGGIAAHGAGTSGRPGVGESP